MVWFTLALFVVSFIVTALLAPRPDLENARASTLNDINFPIASENAPLPIVLGRVRHQGPNTIWYGGFRTEEITERIRVSIFKKETVVVGYRYYLTMDMGLGLGPDIRLREIYIDEELAWSGDTAGATTTNISISRPELFGGYKEGGGWVSTGLFYNGAFDQPVDSAVEAVVGTGQVPAYRGTSHIVFNDAYIGESANLRRIAFVLEQSTNDLSLANNGLVGTEGDVNPAEALYQILIDDWYGLNIPPTSFNIPSFQAVGATMLSEGNGCSILITSESDGKRVVSELLRQMDAIMYQDPTTGEIHIDAIRDDYVIADLPILDEDTIVEVSSFTKTAWDEVFSQTKVQFQQRDSESDAIAISQDMAAFNTLGRLKTQTLSFPFVYNSTLANNIASRERAQSSVPLFRATLEVNRNAYQLRPGSVFVFNFDEYNIAQLIMRVQRFDLGSLLEGRMVIEAIQDNFAIEDTVFADPAESAWTNVVYGPTDISNSELVQTPRFMAQKGTVPIPAARYGITPLAAKPAIASSNYTMHVQTPEDLTVDDGTTEPVNVLYHGSGLLSVEYSSTEGFVTGQDTTTGLSLNGVVGTFAASYSQSQIEDEYFGLLRINDEFLAYQVATDNGSGNWVLTNIWRGLLGTRPETHAINSRVYSVDSAAFGRGVEDFAPDGTSYNLRLLDVSAGITQDPNFQTAATFSVASAANNLNASPIRPGNLELGGTRELSPTITDQVDRTLTWVTRSFDGTQIAFETDAAEILPYSESYAIDVFVDGSANLALSGSVAAGVTSYVVPFSTTVLASSNAEIRVTPTDEDSSVSGLEYSAYPIILQQEAAPTAPTRRAFGTGFLEADALGNVVNLPITINANDLILIHLNSDGADAAGSAPAWSGLPVTTAGYTTLVDGWVGGFVTNGTAYRVAAGGETTVTIDGQQGRRATYIIEVWEAVDPVTPFDGVTPVVFTNTTPEDVTSNTDNAVSVVVGYLDDDETAGSIVAIDLYENLSTSDTDGAASGQGATVASNTRVIETAGLISPAAWLSLATDSRQVAHFVLKPVTS